MYEAYIGCAAGKFLTFKRSKLTKNEKKNLKQNSKARIMKKKVTGDNTGYRFKLPVAP
jgi:hypothetical protein